MKAMAPIASIATIGFLLILTLHSTALVSGTPSSLAKSTPPASMEAMSWKEHTISPVANFMNFEDPLIRMEIRPVFAVHNIDGGFVTGGGGAYAGGVQVRYAVIDRFAVFLNQGGYFEVQPEFGESFSGWADLGFGVK